MHLYLEKYVCTYCKEASNWENLETAPPHRPRNFTRATLDAPDTSSNTRRPLEVSFGFIGQSHMNATGGGNYGDWDGRHCQT